MSVLSGDGAPRGVGTVSRPPDAGKHGGWSWNPFRKRDGGSNGQEAKPVVSSSSPTVTEPAAIKETPQDPEAVQASLRGDIAKVVELQVEAHFKERDIESNDQRALEKKVVVEKLLADSRELSTDLIGRLDNARNVLGNFCKVVERDGDKAVVLLGPLSREVKHIVTDRQDPKKSAYVQKDTVADTFFINKGGVYKVSVADPEAHKLEPIAGSSWKGEYLERQGESERQALETQSLDWRRGTYLAFDTEENIPRHVHVTPREEHHNPTRRAEEEKKAHDLRDLTLMRLTFPHSGKQEGVQQYDSGLAEEMGSTDNLLWGGAERVTTSLDATAAFDASVEGAKTYKDGTHLIPPTPNPVSAEPNPTP